MTTAFPLPSVAHTLSRIFGFCVPLIIEVLLRMPLAWSSAGIRIRLEDVQSLARGQATASCEYFSY
jgi:hypothetical protein